MQTRPEQMMNNRHFTIEPDYQFNSVIGITNSRPYLSMGMKRSLVKPSNKCNKTSVRCDVNRCETLSKCIKGHLK